MSTVPSTAELISAARTIAAALQAGGWHDDGHHPVLAAVSLELEGTYVGDVDPQWLDEMLDDIESEADDRGPAPSARHLCVVQEVEVAAPAELSPTLSSLPDSHGTDRATQPHR